MLPWGLADRLRSNLCFGPYRVRGSQMSAPFSSPQRSSALPVTLIRRFRKCVASSRTRPPGARGWILVACAWLVIAAARTPCAALDSHQSLAQMYHTAWTGTDGLSGMVFALAQTTDGYLWVGTTEGLFRFNGISFELYKPLHGSFRSRSVSALLATTNGGLWIGYLRGGASYLKHGRVTNYSTSKGFPFGIVRRFVQDLQGNIWVAATGGLGLLQGHRWKTHFKSWGFIGDSPDQLFVDDRGTLWVGTGTQIVYLPRGTRHFINTHISCPVVEAFSESPNGRVWFLDYYGMRMVPLPRQNGVRQPGWLTSTSSSQKAIFDRDGAFWVGNLYQGKGLRRIPSEKMSPQLDLDGLNPIIQFFGKKQGLTGSSVYCVLEDREGNIWVGTDGGLDRFRHRNLTWYPLLSGAHDYSLVAGPKGNIWAGVNPGRVVHIPDLKIVPGSPSNVVGAVRAPDGSIWLYPVHNLWHWQNGTFTEVPLPPTALSNRVESLAVTRSGTVWASISGSGEYYLHHGRWTWIGLLSNHPDWTANVAYAGSHNHVWIGVQNKIAEADHGKIRVYSARQGLALGPILAIGGNSQQLWVGGEKGLALLRGDEFHKIYDRDKHSFGVVTGLVVTSRHGLWMTATDGIVHIFQRDVAKVLRNPAVQVNDEVFNMASDLPQSPESLGLYFHTIVKGRNGVLWVQTTSGVARLDPSRIVRNPLPPLMSIRAGYADGTRYSPYANAVMPPHTQDVRIDYDGLGLSIPQRVSFRYRLKGLEKNWIQAASRRQAFFTNLTPGRYAFEVLASNSNGVWATTPAVWHFTILPAWYQTLWFKSLVWTTVAALLWIFYLFRLRQISAAIQNRLDARLRERERIARELHDTLLQGFQGLVLRFQAVLQQMPIDHPLHDTVEKALVRADGVLIEGRERVRELRMESEPDLRNLLAEFGMSQASESTTFQLILVGTVKPLQPLICEEASFISREALMNAFRHAAATRIETELIYSSSHLTIRIRDDGIGIDEKMVAAGRSGHWGLQGMRERASALGGQLSIWSHPGAGTEVELVIPGRLAYTKEEGQWPASRFGRLWKKRR